MHIFVTLILATSFGLIQGPELEAGDDCDAIGKFMVENDYITHDYTCIAWPIVQSTPPLPERNEKR